MSHIPKGLPTTPEQNPKASIQQNSLACTGPYLDETQTVGKLFLSRMPVETKQELLLAMALYGLDQNSTFGLPPLNTDKRGADDAWDADNNKFSKDRHMPTNPTVEVFTQLILEKT